ncbi:Os07g0271550, partial [Oryza sativa Japonica Group]
TRRRRLLALPAQLVQREDHRSARHVPVVAEHTAARRQLAGLEAERRVDLVHDRRRARVHRPEQVVPPAAAVAAEKWAEHVQEAPLDVVPDEPRDLPPEDAVQAALREPHVQGVVRLRDDRLRRRHYLEQRALDVVGVGADNDGGRAVAEQALDEERPEAALVGPGEVHEGELGGDDEDARAAAVLGEVLGEAERGAAGEAAVEVEHGAAHGGAEAEERDEAEVDTRDVGAGVGGDDEVGDVGGRAAPLGDRLLGGLRRQLRHGVRGDVQPRVERRRVAVHELRVCGQHLLRVVQVPPLHAHFLT